MRCAIRRGLCLPPAPWVMTGTRWGSVLSQHHHFFHHQRGYKGMFLKKIWCSAKQARRQTFFFALDYLKSWGPHWGSNLVAILIFWTCMSLSTATHLHQAVMCGPYYMYLSGRKFSWSFSESYCEALAPWRRVIYLAGEETLPLWKHSSNRWRQPISPTFSLRCHPGMQDFLFYLPLINFTSQIKYCLATIGEYHKSYQSMENKISEFFAIVSKAGRDTWEEVIKYLQVAEEQTWREKSSNEVTAQLFHWTKRTEKEKEKH